MHSFKSLEARKGLSAQKTEDLKLEDQQALREAISSALFYFIENCISVEERLRILEKGNADVLIQLLADKLSSFTLEAFKETSQISGISKKEKLEILFLSHLELLVCSIERSVLSKCLLVSSLDFPEFIFIDVFMKLSSDLEDNTEVSANLKFEIFKNRVDERNLAGWLVRKTGFGTTSNDHEYKRNCVSVKERYRRQFVNFFELNPDFSAETMFTIQVDSVLAGSAEKQDNEFDRLYHCRRAVDSGYLVSKIEKILEEMEMSELFSDIRIEPDSGVE